MTGPEHYRDAELWARYAATQYEAFAQDHDQNACAAGFLAAQLALAHATLAAAAAGAAAVHRGRDIAWFNVDPGEVAR